jgi:NAD(P)-dependent dehydrogenase (short-subunit alcohol dehydrogenase family)
MTQESLLEEKVIVITGSGSGVGRGIALEAGRLGAKIIVNDIDKTEGGRSTADRVVAVQAQHV